MSEAPKQWFYVEGGERRGPVSEEDLAGLLQSGRLGVDSLVWTQGMGDWKPVSGIADLAQHVSAAAQGGSAADADDGGSGLDREPMFLHIPMGRMVLMSLLSLGIYEAYWMYMNWRYLKNKYNLPIQPFWRAVFGVFFCYALFTSIHDDKETNAVKKAEFPAGVLALGWIVLMVVSNLMSRFGGTAVSMVALAISVPSFMFFMPLQRYINDVNGAREPKPAYYHWSTGHIVMLVFGCILWPLIILGLMFPELQSE